MTTLAPDELPIAQRNAARRRLQLLLAPGLGWLVVFFVIPLIIVLLYSFAAPGPTGQVIWTFSFDN